MKIASGDECGTPAPCLKAQVAYNTRVTAGRLTEIQKIARPPLCLFIFGSHRGARWVKSGASKRRHAVFAGTR